MKCARPNLAKHCYESEEANSRVFYVVIYLYDQVVYRIILGKLLLTTKILFLASGHGGNLKFAYLLSQVCPALDISLSVIGDRECGAIDFARAKGMHYELLSLDGRDQNNLAESIKQLGPDLIVTTIHKVLSDSITKTFSSQLVNIHYSLLPNHAGLIGLKSLERAIENRDFLLGVTTHRVNEVLDGGTPFVQSCFQNTFDLRTAVKISFRIGCKQIWSIINGLVEPDNLLPRVSEEMIFGSKVHHIPQIVALPSEVNNRFWSELSEL